MVASGGNNQYSKKRDIWKVYRHGTHESNVKGVFSKTKPQKMKLTIPKTARTFQTQAIQ